jgi:hypothetical protein
MQANKNGSIVEFFYALNNHAARFPCTVWRGVVSFTLHLFCPREKFTVITGYEAACPRDGLDVAAMRNILDLDGTQTQIVRAELLCAQGRQPC